MMATLTTSLRCELDGMQSRNFPKKLPKKVPREYYRMAGVIFPGHEISLRDKRAFENSREYPGDYIHVYACACVYARTCTRGN